MTAGRDAVLLLHGLWMNRLVMQYLGTSLARAGFSTHTLAYRSMQGTLSEHRALLAQSLADLPEPRVHLVGHSMGGVIAMDFLGHLGRSGKEGAGQRMGRTLLLGSPVVDCGAARDFGESAGGRLMLGESVTVWREAFPLKVPPDREVGAIAGTKRLGLAQLFVDIPGDNDGVVSVAETRLAGLADHIVLPVSHTGMLFSSAVADQCAAFLKDGRFAR